MQFNLSKRTEALKSGDSVIYSKLEKEIKSLIHEGILNGKVGIVPYGSYLYDCRSVDSTGLYSLAEGKKIVKIVHETEVL